MKYSKNMKILNMKNGSATNVGKVLLNARTTSSEIDAFAKNDHPYRTCGISAVICGPPQKLKMAPKSSIPFEASSKKSKKRQAKSHVLSTRHPAGWLAGVSAFSNVNIYKENEKPAF